MIPMQDVQKQILLRSLDQELTSEEQAQLEAALLESAALRQEKAELLQMRELVAGLRMRRDSDFPVRVMTRLRKERKGSFLADLVSLSPKVAAACILFMLATLFSIYLREGRLTPEVIIGVEHLTPEDAIGIQNARLNRKQVDKAMEMPKRDRNKRESDDARLH